MIVIVLKNYPFLLWPLSVSSIQVRSPLVEHVSTVRSCFFFFFFNTEDLTEYTSFNVTFLSFCFYRENLYIYIYAAKPNNDI